MNEFNTIFHATLAIYTTTSVDTLWATNIPETIGNNQAAAERSHSATKDAVKNFIDTELK